MEKIYFDILQKWAEYSNYDPKQKTFNLMNFEWECNQVTKQIEHINEVYDETGMLAVMLVKETFLNMLSNTKVSMADVMEQFQHPDATNEFSDDMDMYRMFMSDEVKVVEDNYVEKINIMSQRIIGKPLIGKNNEKKFKEKVFSCTNNVISQLDKCHLEVYQKGMEIKEIKNISTNIHIFASLGQCLLTLSNAEDGIYLCYIDVCGTADSYFGFFIKNNGNIFSLNERVNEAYRGSHQHSRNGRWTENKIDEIFPYDFIFKYSDCDYKGYSSKYSIDKNKCSFSEMGENAYIPLLLAMMFISKIYTGKHLEEDLVYTESLLPAYIPQITSDKAEIAVINKNEIVESHSTVNLEFNIKDVLNGTAAKEFNGKSISSNNNQLMVDLYGKDFIYQPFTPKLNMIEDSSGSYTPEFVGSEKTIRSQIYYDIRQQLASYIREQMHKEYISFGGFTSIKEWYINAIIQNMGKIEKHLAVKYYKIQNGDSNLSAGWSSGNPNIKTDISFCEGSYPGGYNATIINKNEGTMYKEKHSDMRTGSKCCCWFVLRPKHYLAIEELIGAEVPKIVKGWQADGHFTSGNSILSMTDCVESVGTPFEIRLPQSHWL